MGEAGHDAGGLIIDMWHTERGGTPPAELAAVPLRHIVGVELSDADAAQVGTLFEDTANRRRLCGEGSFDLQGCISAPRRRLDQALGVEILSEAFRRLPVREAVAAAFHRRGATGAGRRWPLTGPWSSPSARWTRPWSPGSSVTPVVRARPGPGDLAWR